MLGQIVAPLIDGKLVLPKITPVNTLLPAKLAKAMRKWCEGRSCMVCGGTKTVQAHHLFPRHIWPQLMYREEFWVPLDRDNPVLDCHCLIGHGGDFKGYNPFCVAMAELLRPVLRANKNILAAIRAEDKRRAAT
jgi:hypothetical protein